MRFQLKDVDGNSVKVTDSCLAMYGCESYPKKGDTFRMIDGRTFVVEGGPIHHQFSFGPGGLETRAEVIVRKVETK